MKICFRIFVLAVCAIAFSGCGYHEVALGRGEFDVNSHPNFTGVGKDAPKQSKMRSLTLSGTYVHKDKVHVDKLWNDVSSKRDESVELVDSKVDFDYRFKGIPVAFNFTSLSKGNICLSGYSLGLDPFPYVRYIFGMNRPFFELGVFGDVGFAWNSGSYTYLMHSMPPGISLVDYYTEGEKKDRLYNHVSANFGGFASFYIGSTSINYSPSLYAPWRTSELDDSDIFFDFPKIVMQYVGLSQWLGEHWKFSAGATFASSIYFDNFAVSGTGSLGYWF